MLTFLMGRGADGVEALELAVATARQGANVAAVVAQKIVENRAQIGSQADGWRIGPVRRVGQKMGLFPREAQAGEFGSEFVHIRSLQQRPVAVDVAAQRRQICGEEVPGRLFLFLWSAV